MVGFTGVRPPATPGLGVAGEGAGEVEETAASTFVCSSELGRRGIGGATAMKNRRRSGSVGGVLRCGRGGEGSVVRCDLLRGARALYRGRGRAPETIVKGG